MDQFWKEFETGEIHFRDRWQFELKSEFRPLSAKKRNIYFQEFFIFVPNSLQINAQTYSKEEFYQSQTNLIRFKTPTISFTELLNSKNEDSPLNKISDLLQKPRSEENLEAIKFELKLFANIWSSDLRKEVDPLTIAIEKTTSYEELAKCKAKIDYLIFDLFGKLLNKYQELEAAIFQYADSSELEANVKYVRDIISLLLNTALGNLLLTMRSKNHPLLNSTEKEIAKLLLREKNYREGNQEISYACTYSKEAKEENISFRMGVLSKFIIEALQLQTTRLNTTERYRPIVAGIAATFAMSIYMFLFILQGTHFVINSVPFIIGIILAYVLKDAVKEDMKRVSYRWMFKWLPDFTTEIRSLTGKVIGKLHESFSFAEYQEIPREVRQMRNEGFHTDLIHIKRPEQVLHYKRQIDLSKKYHPVQDDLNALSIIFRYDIHRFLAKGSDPYEPYLDIDNQTFEITRKFLPKVYHINIILKNSDMQPNLKEKIEWKRYKLIVNKDGIKRIES